MSISVLRSANAGAPGVPTAIKKARGTLKSEQINEREPKPDVIAIPPPPDDLSDVERAEWIELAKVIDPLHIVTASDIRYFRMLVQSLAICETAARAIFEKGKDGLYSYAESGRPMVAPDVSILAQHQKIAAYHMSRFGLSPADRRRVSSFGGSDDSSPLAEFSDAG